MNRISKNSINSNLNMNKVQRYLHISPAQGRACKSDCDTAAALAIKFVDEGANISYGDAINIFVGMLTECRGVPQWYADAYRKVCFIGDRFYYPTWQQVLLAGLRLSRFDDYEF